MIFNLQQSMTEFMTFMRTTMENLMRNQDLLIQMLVSQQSKKSMAPLRITLWNAKGVS